MGYWDGYEGGESGLLSLKVSGEQDIKDGVANEHVLLATMCCYIRVQPPEAVRYT